MAGTVKMSGNRKILIGLVVAALIVGGYFIFGGGFGSDGCYGESKIFDHHECSDSYGTPNTSNDGYRLTYQVDSSESGFNRYKIIMSNVDIEMRDVKYQYAWWDEDNHEFKKYEEHRHFTRANSKDVEKDRVEKTEILSSISINISEENGTRIPRMVRVTYENSSGKEVVKLYGFDLEDIL